MRSAQSQHIKELEKQKKQELSRDERFDPEVLERD